jgi:hypothetical protein
VQVGLVLRRATWGARFKARSGSRLPMLISVQQLRRLMIAPSSLFWGVTEGYVCLACLSRSGSSTILLPSVLTQAISGLFVAQPTCISSAKTVTKAESCRRRLLMRYP